MRGGFTWFAMLLALIFGFMAGYEYRARHSPTLPELELAAYRDCMEQAQRCRMTPQDFIRYYELKHKLEIDDAKTNTE